MAQMIRKQIYIARHQLAMLTRLAVARGVSEAEVIRQAIEHEATGDFVQRAVSDTAALDEIIRYALSRRKTGITGQPLRWNRTDVYSERLDRYGPDEQMAG